MDFYTSDTHYYHTNVIKYCLRPFVDVADMHETLIRLWNDRVGHTDTVFHLGDFGFGSAEQQSRLVKKLHGRKVIIKGNHDKGLVTLKDMGFKQAELEGFHTDSALKVPVYMRHKPNLDYAILPFFSAEGIHLCGHVHEKWARQGNIINVGVDQSWFAPLTLAELIDRPEETRTWLGPA